MPSPFPGMDPYIESPFFWPGFHGNMVSAMMANLNARLPGRYVAASDRHVYLREPGEEGRRMAGGPDVHVADRQARPGGAVAVAEPVRVRLPLVRREGQRFLRIYDRNDRRVVTVVELLSPSNKGQDEDGAAYLTKRNDYLVNGVNLVEIDLLRAGGRLPLDEVAPPASHYAVLVCRAVELPQASHWGFSVRDPFPAVPVPLDPGVDDATLDLRWCLGRVYDESRYETELPYNSPPAPPLREPDAAWARDLLAARRGGEGA